MKVNDTTRPLNKVHSLESNTHPSLGLFHPHEIEAMPTIRDDGAVAQADEDIVDTRPALSIENSVATITLQRPSQHNRIDPDDVPILRGLVASAATLSGISVLIVTGSGSETFSAGYTIDAIVDRLDMGFERLLDELETLSIPTICALNGSVYGGATDLALCCDLRIGVRGSRMFMPAARLGLHYYPGGLRRFVTALGVTQAKRVFLAGETLNDEEMLRIGFLTHLVDHEHLSATVRGYASMFSEGVPGVVRSMKQQLVHIARGHPDGTSRAMYEASLRSKTLRDRIAARRRSR